MLQAFTNSNGTFNCKTLRFTIDLRPAIQNIGSGKFFSVKWLFVIGD